MSDADTLRETTKIHQRRRDWPPALVRVADWLLETPYVQARPDTALYYAAQTDDIDRNIFRAFDKRIAEYLKEE